MVVGHPVLAEPVSRQQDVIVVGDGPGAVEVRVDGRAAQPVQRFLELLDGTRSVESVARSAGLDLQAAGELLEALDREHLVALPSTDAAVPGTTALLALEDLTTDALYRTLYRNPYWQALQREDEPVPELVLYGTIVENYHFLFRESSFDAPVLSYPYSRRARVSLTEFFGEESGHDELILASLVALGYSREDLARTIPLQTTAALCNALVWWARTDPLFFVATIGVLEGRDLAVDSFVHACERQGVDPAVVGPMRRHSEINLEGGHGSLTRVVFADIPAIDGATMARLRAQTGLFVELYDDFYRGVWEHYSSASELLRRIPTVLGVSP